MNLRHCEIQKIEFSNRENSNPKKICLFHKWFDGLNDTFEVPRQYAIVEHHNGKVEQISIEEYSIRFLTKAEIERLHRKETNKAIDHMFGEK